MPASELQVTVTLEEPEVNAILSAFNYCIRAGAANKFAESLPAKLRAALAAVEEGTEDEPADR